MRPTPARLSNPLPSLPEEWDAGRRRRVRVLAPGGVTYASVRRHAPPRTFPAPVAS